MNEDKSSQSEIIIRVALGDDRIPKKIKWTAVDQQQIDQEAKAMLLSFFDGVNKETLKIDLWTSEMQVVEMDRFMFQTPRSLSDTYYRATNNQKLASAMQQFVQYFGEETDILKKGAPSSDPRME